MGLSIALIKDILKFKILPKKPYLCYSARNKYRRADKGEPEIRLLPFLVDKNKVAIDVGANTGLYTYYLSKLAKNVYAFEPHKKLADFLTGATASNVIVINKAVSDNDNEVTFYTPVIAGKKSLNIASCDKKMVGQHECVETKVQTVPIDSLSIENVGFIKIDVEGHELSVLKGAVETIKKYKPTLLVEILSENNQKLAENETILFMKRLGYEMFNLHNNTLQLMTEGNSTKAGRNIIFIPKKASS